MLDLTLAGYQQKILVEPRAHSARYIVGDNGYLVAEGNLKCDESFHFRWVPLSLLNVNIRVVTNPTKPLPTTLQDQQTPEDVPDRSALPAWCTA